MQQAGNSIGGAVSQDGTLVAAQNYQPGGIKVFDAKTLALVADELDRMTRLVDDIDLLVLKQAGLVGELIRAAKVVKTGELSRKVSLKGLGATAGAKAAIEAAGGTVG